MVFTITAQGVSPIINNYTVTATVASAVLWNVAGSGVWDTATPNWLTQPGAVSTKFATGNAAIFSNIAGGTITTAPGISPGSTTVNATAGTYIFEGGPIAGTGALTKDGASTLTLASANTYQGKTAVKGGTLETVGNRAIGGSTSFTVARACPTGDSTRWDKGLRVKKKRHECAICASCPKFVVYEQRSNKTPTTNL